MARPSVLPLPDSSVRHILAHVDELRMSFPVERGNRPFLAAFLRLVHGATGEVFGASIVRKLLRTYAPEYRPSTDTIHSELLLFRQYLDQTSDITAAQPASADPIHVIHTGVVVEPNEQTVHYAQSVDLANLSALIAGLQRSLANAPVLTASTADNPQYEALARALEAENQRLRAYSDNLVAQLEEARRSKTEILQQYESTKAERDTYQKVSTELSQQLADLSQIVKAADDRTAASHRFALGRIEEATVEVRRLKDLLSAEKERTAAIQRRLEDEQSMSMALRQLANKLKAEAAQRGYDE